MPTLDEWERALSSPRLVTIESSLQLIADIQEKQVKHDARPVGQRRTTAQRKPQLTPVPGLPSEILIEPIYLLHRLGVVTTPAVENLADICSSWAYFRYLWGFDLPDGSTRDRLRLSSPALKIDFHQKGLMSDQIGVGMAALIMDALLNAPYAADVSVAMDDPAWPVGLIDDASPDYIFSSADQSIVYVVECKGTRSSRSAAVDQLRRGVEQLPSLIFLDGRPQPPSLVIGTYMSASSVQVYVVDPPSDLVPPQDRPVKIGAREWKIPDGRVLENAARHVSQAKILAYAGSDGAAITKLEQVSGSTKDFPRITPRELVTDENEFGIFRGIRQQLPARDNMRVEVFQAIYEPLQRAYIEDDVDIISEEVGRLGGLARIGTGGVGGLGFTREQRASSHILRSFASDGTLLEIRLTPP